MNDPDDGVPTEEQLDRIRRRVGERIERRRSVARGLAGSAVAVALLAGGVAVLPHVVSSSGGSSSGAGAAGSSASRPAHGSAAVEVRCHATSRRGSGEQEVRAADGSPAAAVHACLPSAVEFQVGRDRVPAAGESSRPASLAPASGPSASPASLAVVCRGGGGTIHVVPADGAPATLCERLGLRPY